MGPTLPRPTYSGRTMVTRAVWRRGGKPMSTHNDDCEKARKESEQAFIIGLVFVFLVVAVVRLVNDGFSG